MQIGFPTDVKHVAHIGWDGPSVTSPSWMSDFKPTTESSSAPLGPTGGEAKGQHKSSSQDFSHSGASVGFHESLARDIPVPVPEVQKPSRRRQSSGASSFDATIQDTPLDVPKQSSRRQKPSSSGLTITSPARDSTSFDGDKKSRKSPKDQDSPTIPKQSRRKKSKGSSGGAGSTRSRTKVPSTYTSPFSDPGTGSSSSAAAALNNNSTEAYCPTSALKALDLEEKGCDRIVS